MSEVIASMIFTPGWIAAIAATAPMTAPTMGPDFCESTPSLSVSPSTILRPIESPASSPTSSAVSSMSSISLRACSMSASTLSVDFLPLSPSAFFSTALISFVAGRAFASSLTSGALFSILRIAPSTAFCPEAKSA